MRRGLSQLEHLNPPINIQKHHQLGNYFEPLCDLMSLTPIPYAPSA